MKKLLLLLIMMLLPMMAMADSSGTCGDNLTWTLVESTGTLTISGTGAMNNYNDPMYYTSDISPWYNDWTKIKSVVIEDGVTSIGSNAFLDCQLLTSVAIPNSVISIGSSSFYHCTGLTFVTVSNSVTTIGNYAFYYCSGLTSVTIGNSVTSIGEYAFYKCNGLTSITIPNSVTSIANLAFSDCADLTSVTIGSGIKTIKYGAFGYCFKLADVYCYAETAPISVDAFQSSDIKNVTLHVPEASVYIYSQTDPWKNFKEIVSLNGTMPEMPKCATPTIKYIGGKLLFECETEGVEFVYSITTPANTTNQTGNNVDMPHTNIVSVYAKKEGYLNSDVATENIDVRGIQGDTNRDGVVTVADAVGVVNIILEKNE